MTSTVLAVGVFALLTPALAWANAIPDLQRLRNERMSLDDLMADARQKGIRRFDEIELAVLETNGRVSFFTRAGGAGEDAPEQPGIA
nr:YetF domain-containing protein [Rhodococcus opacus]